MLEYRLAGLEWRACLSEGLRALFLGTSARLCSIFRRKTIGCRFERRFLPWQCTGHLYAPHSRRSYRGHRARTVLSMALMAVAA